MINSSTSVHASDHFQMDARLAMKTTSPSSSRILDIPCKVCGDFSSGKHYNIFACDGCAGFFKRSIRRNRQYVCKAKDEGTCVINKVQRNQCRACRLLKCQEAGMNKDAVQHERGPRNSTLRRQQMAHFYTDPREALMLSSTASALNLALPKTDTGRSTVSPLLPPAAYMCNPSIAFPGMPFPLTLSSSLLPGILNPSATCESAARLLLMNVEWAKSVTAFRSLCLPDQLLLLKETWRELFILGATHYLVPFEISSLVHTSGAIERRPEDPTNFLVQVKEFQDVLIKLTQTLMDATELSFMRAIVLFKTSFEGSSGDSSPSRGKSLINVVAVTAIQDQTQLMLNKYTTATYPGQPLRFGKLLMILPVLRSVPTDIIEELFFRKTIGDTPIETIICNMYKSASTLMAQ